MTDQTYELILLVAGAVIVALLYIVDRRGRDLRDSIPVALLPIVEIAVKGAVELAKRTPSPDDDALIRQIAERLEIELDEAEITAIVDKRMETHAARTALTAMHESTSTEPKA